MTKNEFCEKWQRGWRKLYHDGTEAYFKTEEQMMNDLDQVIYFEVVGWKKFVDASVEKTVDLDEFLEAEAADVQQRKKAETS